MPPSPFINNSAAVDAVEKYYGYSAFEKVCLEKGITLDELKALYGGHTESQIHRGISHLVEAYLMVEKGYPPQQVFDMAPTTEDIAEAAHAINDYLENSFINPNPDAVRNHAWFSRIMAEAGEKLRDYLVVQGNTDRVSMAQPLAGLTQRHVYLANRMVFDFLQMSSLPIYQEHLGEYFWRKANPQADPNVPYRYEPAHSDLSDDVFYLPLGYIGVSRTAVATLRDTMEKILDKGPSDVDMSMLIFNYRVSMTFAAFQQEHLEAGKRFADVSGQEYKTNHFIKGNTAIAMPKKIVPETDNGFSLEQLWADSTALSTLPADAPQRAYLTEKLLFSVHMMQQDRLYTDWKMMPDGNLSVKCNVHFPTPQEVEQFLGKGVRLSDVEFLDDNGKVVSMGAALAQAGAEGRLMFRNVHTREWKVVSPRDGFAEIWPNQKAAGDEEKKAAAKHVAKAVRKSWQNPSVPQAQAMNDIAAALKGYLKSLDSNDPWYIHSSKQFRSMTEGLKNLIHAAESGDMDAFQAAFVRQKQLNIAYKQHSDRKESLSDIAKKRLASMEQLDGILASVKIGLTIRQAGPVRQEFMELYQQSTGTAAPEELIDDKKLNEVFGYFSSGRDKFIRMQNGEEVSLSANEIAAISTLGKVMYGLRKCDPAYTDPMRVLDVTGHYLRNSGDQSTVSSVLNSLRKDAGGAYTMENFQEDFNRACYISDLYRQKNDGALSEKELHDTLGAAPTRTLMELEGKGIITAQERKDYKAALKTAAEDNYRHEMAMQEILLKDGCCVNGRHIHTTGSAAKAEKLQLAFAEKKALQAAKCPAAAKVEFAIAAISRPRSASVSAPKASKNNPVQKQAGFGPKL